MHHKLNKRVKFWEDAGANSAMLDAGHWMLDAEHGLAGVREVDIPAFRVTDLLALESLLLFLGDAHEDHLVATRVLLAQIIGDGVLAILLLEIHTGNILVADKCLYGFDKIGRDPTQESRGGNLVAEMPGQEVRQLTFGLQRRNVAVEIQAIEALNIEQNVFLEDFSNCWHNRPPFPAASYRIGGKRERAEMSYRNLTIWQESRGIVVDVHKMTLTKLPTFELYEEGSQIRRSIKSVKSNIVEGYGRRRYKQEYIRFLTFAQASCDETTVISFDLIGAAAPAYYAALVVQCLLIRLGHDDDGPFAAELRREVDDSPSRLYLDVSVPNASQNVKRQTCCSDASCFTATPWRGG